MKVNFDEYNWKLIGSSKDGCFEKDITIFSEIAGDVINRIMLEMARCDAIFSLELVQSEEYKNTKRIKTKASKNTESKINISDSGQQVDKNSEKKLLNFISGGKEEFDTGELFILAAVLDAIDESPEEE